MKYRMGNLEIKYANLKKIRCRTSRCGQFIGICETDYEPVVV